MNDHPHTVWTPLIEWQDSISSLRVMRERAVEAANWNEFAFWVQRGAWHHANAIGWASRD